MTELIKEEKREFRCVICKGEGYWIYGDEKCWCKTCEGTGKIILDYPDEI